MLPPPNQPDAPSSSPNTAGQQALCWECRYPLPRFHPDTRCSECGHAPSRATFAFRPSLRVAARKLLRAFLACAVLRLFAILAFIGVDYLEITWLARKTDIFVFAAAASLFIEFHLLKRLRTTRAFAAPQMRHRTRWSTTWVLPGMALVLAILARIHFTFGPLDRTLFDFALLIGGAVSLVCMPFRLGVVLNFFALICQLESTVRSHTASRLLLLVPWFIIVQIGTVLLALFVGAMNPAFNLYSPLGILCITVVFLGFSGPVFASACTLVAVRPNRPN